MRSPLLLLIASLAVACSTHHAIEGSVINRNGEPMERVIVKLEPGGVELVTNTEGRYSIDYLRDDMGERVKLERRSDYSLEVFRPGYHVQDTDFYYKRGTLELEPLTLVEDTIRVNIGEGELDPTSFPDRSHSAGSNYEGE